MFGSFQIQNIPTAQATTNKYSMSASNLTDELFRRFIMMNKKYPCNLKYELSLISIFVLLLSPWISLAIPQNKTMIPVGLVLDDYSSVRGKIFSSVFQMAIDDISAYHPSYKTRLVLKNGESRENVVGAAAAGKLNLHTYHN